MGWRGFLDTLSPFQIQEELLILCFLQRGWTQGPVLGVWGVEHTPGCGDIRIAGGVFLQGLDVIHSIRLRDGPPLARLGGCPHKQAEI